MPDDQAPAAMNAHEHARITDVLARYPERSRPGLDLPWHIDRSIEYIANIVDRRRDHIPFYRACIYREPRKLAHAEWDVPHCVGRLLDAMMLWERSFGQRVPDEENVQALRALLLGSIWDEDHLAHFPAYCRENKEIDWHSQREVMLALLGLHRQRGDDEALDYAKRLVHGYHAKSDHDGFPVDTAWSGRFIEALLAYHRVTNDPLAVIMSQRFADDFMTRYFDDEGTFPRPGNNQSHIQTLCELIEYGYYTNQDRYVAKAKRVIDNGLWGFRTKYGYFCEGDGPRGETNCCGDLIKAEIMLGLHGHPDAFDDAEKILRNHMLASQYLDPTPHLGDTAEALGLSDTDNEVYTQAAERGLGGFAFTLPNDLIDATLWEVADVPADMVGGVMHGMLAVWDNAITRNDRGLSVNFLISKETESLDVRSHIPAEGRLELSVKHPENVFVRIPNHVNVEKLNVQINGVQTQERVIGSHVFIPKQAEACEAVVTFPQRVAFDKETVSGTEYNVEWIGDTVWNVDPPGDYVPLYTPARLAMFGPTPRVGQ